MCDDSARARLTEDESLKPIESKQALICRFLSVSFLQNPPNAQGADARSRDKRLPSTRRRRAHRANDPACGASRWWRGFDSLASAPAYASGSRRAFEHGASLIPGCDGHSCRRSSSVFAMPCSSERRDEFRDASFDGNRPEFGRRGAVADRCDQMEQGGHLFATEAECGNCLASGMRSWAFQKVG